ncbi:hypothetical protein Tco_1545061, partial [Tanacetum coccineum]
AYVPDPMELDEHVPIYVPEPEHPEYHAPSDDDIQVRDQPYADDASPTTESPGYIADSDSMEEDTDEDSIDYLDKLEDGEEDDDEDPEEDPSKEHELEDEVEDPEEDPNEEHEPKDEDTKDEEPYEGSDETEPFEEDDTATLIDVFATGSPPFPLPPTYPAYDQAPLGHRAAMIRMIDDILEEDIPPLRRFVLTVPLPRCDVAESFVVATARAPRGQYDFVDTVEVGQGLIHSLSHDARTIARVADRAEDVGYVRALQASEHKMRISTRHRFAGKRVRISIHSCMTLRLTVEALDSRLMLELLARLETLKTHMSRMEWQRQRAKDDAVRQMMRIHVLEARAQIDMVEDTDSSR